ncbi:hypothetical protein AB7B76_26490 [Klebsiella pneumoniae]|uniref:hypothetical protein n=1 Tax=Klebsiella pneumoniae TaxID=573 RepID=UPI0034E33822
MSHTTGIHLPDQKIALRNPVQGHNQERWRLLWPTNPLSSQPRRRATSAVQGLNCLDMPEALYEGVTSALVAPFS